MIGTLLPLALVVGLSPLPILPAVLLVLAPDRAPSRAYLAAWLATLTLVVVGATLLGGVADPGDPTEEEIGWVKVATALVFLAMAGAKWMRRPREGEPKEAPGWMAALDTYGPRQAARLGALLVVANPKVLLMAVAAGAELAILSAGPGAVAGGVAGFVAVGSIGVVTPFLVRAVLGERAEPVLDRANAWLQQNGTALSVGVLVLLAVLLLVSGLPGVL